MSDVRSLLRQQRAARRIDHPNAAYSEAGKLLCTLCHEGIKTESLWDTHIRSSNHREKSQQQLAAQKRSAVVDKETNGTHKRKHDSDSDGEDVVIDEATARKKRSRNDMNTPARSGSESSSADVDETSRDQGTQPTKDQTLTPPTLNRRTSTTPVQGGEMLIPSRPATPHHKDGTSSTATPLGPSPLIPQEANAPSERPGNAVSSTATTQQKVDEDEWAAFEADIAAASAPYADDAVISAPAMTAEEHAANARTEEEEREKRRLLAEEDMADEKEEATRALETEFEEMEELEARVRKLKERREALRKQPDVPEEGNPGPGAQEAAPINSKEEGEGDEQDEDDDEEDDDFMGFRFGG
ncbi:hypothetical protein ACHAQH_004419 [Verticillium albo-atrum]